MCDAVRKAGHETEHKMNRKDHDCESGGPIEMGCCCERSVTNYKIYSKSNG